MTMETLSILFIDDEVEALNAIRRALRSRRDRWVMDFVTSVDDALTLFVDSDHDVVVTDLNMPLINGKDAISLFKQYRPGVPVIILTSDARPCAVVDCMKIGADNYVEKPIDADELETMITSLLALKATERFEQTFLVNTKNRIHNAIAGYRVIRTLGEGGIGTVFLAEKTVNGICQRRAVKVLTPHLITDAQRNELHARFLREANVAAELDHPNIVRVVEYGIDDVSEAPYLVMEYVDGAPLKKLIANRVAMGYQCKIAIVRQIACALRAIHDKGVCHRDIKPHNVIVDNDAHVKVTDFGLAQTADSELTNTSVVMGSPAYLSPEALQSARVDGRSDLFALGVLAYELFCYRLPFLGKNFVEIARQIHELTPESPAAIDPRLPEDVPRIIFKLLEKSVENRYQCADELIDDLECSFGAMFGH